MLLVGSCHFFSESSISTSSHVNIPKHLWHGSGEHAIAHAQSSRLLDDLELRVLLSVLPQTFEVPRDPLPAFEQIIEWCGRFPLSRRSFQQGLVQHGSTHS